MLGTLAGFTADYVCFGSLEFSVDAAHSTVTSMHLALMLRLGIWMFSRRVCVLDQGRIDKNRMPVTQPSCGLSQQKFAKQQFARSWCTYDITSLSLKVPFHATEGCTPLAP